jgi:hypothetical protein
VRKEANGCVNAARHSQFTVWILKYL